MRTALTTFVPQSAPTPKSKSRGARFPGGKVLPDHIATAAYFRAQARGFEPGKEIEDWLNAEADLLKQAAEQDK